ncbi:MAG: ribosomal protein S18-alanine N-acetyltransferase [Alcanivorax sp.]|nr:ribosomal protein S18-alanine N-acetyltransferase [Alcanivorax sp.]
MTASDVSPDIRPMELEDLDEVLAIENAAQLTPWGSCHFRDCLKADHYQCLVAVEADRPVAFLILSHILDECHVLNIAVAPSRQRRGLARWLLSQSLQRAREGGMTVVYLEVRAGNSGAQALYQQLGFSECGRRKGYYRLGDGHEDAVLMQCQLGGWHK